MILILESNPANIQIYRGDTLLLIELGSKINLSYVFVTSYSELIAKIDAEELPPDQISCVLCRRQLSDGKLGVECIDLLLKKGFYGGVVVMYEELERNLDMHEFLTRRDSLEMLAHVNIDHRNQLKGAFLFSALQEKKRKAETQLPALK